MRDFEHNYIYSDALIDIGQMELTITYVQHVYVIYMRSQMSIFVNHAVSLGW
jgi:hypothetical protein